MHYHWEIWIEEDPKDEDKLYNIIDEILKPFYKIDEAYVETIDVAA